MRELNLVPHTYSNQKKLIDRKKHVALSIALALVVVVASGGYIFGKEALLKIKRNNLQEQVDSNKELVVKNEALVRDINLTKQHIEKAKQLSVLKGKDTDGLIVELSSLFPSGVKISNITFAKSGNLEAEGLSGSLNLTCEAKSKSDVSHLWANLRESDKFSNSHISGLTGKDKVTFNLKINAKGVNNDVKAEDKQ